MADILGLLQTDVNAFFQGDDADIAAIEALIAARKAARESKDWGKADEVRQQLQDMGIVLEDKAGKTTWKKV